MRSIIDSKDVDRILRDLARQISGEFQADKPLNLVGIRTRGDTIARRLFDLLKQAGFQKLGFGILDVTLYRDDMAIGSPKPMVRPTEIQIDLSDAPLVLVDDVLYTGRSVRAALVALNDFGRPSLIRLAVLVDRGNRELPISADYIGMRLKHVPPDHLVNVHLAETDERDEIIVEPRNG